MVRRRRPRKPWNESWCSLDVRAPRITEFSLRLDLFPPREQRVHRDENGKHDERHERRPLHEEAEHDEYGTPRIADGECACKARISQDGARAACGRGAARTP